MGATSVTGAGVGDCGKLTTTELSTLANGPQIIFTGQAEAVDSVSSPPISTNTVSFPYPLAGGAGAYVVLLTTMNAGAAYVSGVEEDDDDNYTGFSFITETEGTVMYLVAKVGHRPQ